MQDELASRDLRSQAANQSIHALSQMVTIDCTVRYSERTAGRIAKRCTRDHRNFVLFD